MRGRMLLISLRRNSDLLPQTPRAKKVVEGAIEAAREQHLKEQGDHQALLEIAHVLFSYVGAQNAREALTSIHEIAEKALES